jgi:exonuclease III
MKIFNWNLSIINRNIQKSLDFAFSHEADVYCFQEVSCEGLEILKKTGKEIAYEAELVQNGKESGYLVIVSEYPVVNRGSFLYHKGKENSVWESSKIITFFFGSSKEEKKCLYVDLRTGIGIERVYNLHLSWATGPKVRVEQFKNFLKHASPGSGHVICGDLNVISGPIYDLFAFWPFRYKREELFLGERSIFDETIERLGFQNPFFGVPSWPFLGIIRAQLDHILVPYDCEIKNRSDYKKTYGSDHRPQMLEIGK